MAVSDLDLFKVTKHCAGRVPARFHDQMRIESSVRGNSVTIFECRAPWHPTLIDWSRHPVAQLRYDTGALNWTLYWADRNGRWHLLDFVEPGTVDQMLAAIDDDSVGIFWG
ncbi:MAG: hypothetical protein JWM55_1781 [Acidimicrobiaceae bacterium]|nr:hypothetical protein [Acidimicrobiaceae bacterium]